MDSDQTQKAIEEFKALQKAADIEISMEACYRLGMYYLSKEQAKEAENAFKAASRAAGKAGARGFAGGRAMSRL